MVNLRRPALPVEPAGPPRAAACVHGAIESRMPQTRAVTMVRSRSMAATSSAGSSAQTGMVREAILDSSSATKARPDGDSGSHAIHAVDGLGQFSAAVVLTLSLRSLLTNCGWR